MTVSSPLSLQSQLHQSNHYGSDTSDSDLASELDLNTQLPYNNPFEDHHHPSYSFATSQSHSTSHIPGGADEQTGIIQDGVPKAHLPAKLGISVPPEEEQTPPDSLKKTRLVGRGNTTEDNDSTSSDESIECEPFVTPPDKSSPTKSPSAGQHFPEDTGIAQPFPLVEWIKEIRKDTFKPCPMLSMRWAKNISKKQQAILDEDETWLPPLAGRQLRPGSVPLDILQRLTDRADHLATTSSLTSRETAREEHAGGLPQESLPQAQSSSRVNTSRSRHINQADQNSDEETQVPSQWSSSPQRPRVPPDSSPVPEPIPPGTKGSIEERPDAADEPSALLQTDQAEVQQDEVHVPLQINQAKEQHDAAEVPSPPEQDKEQQNLIGKATGTSSAPEVHPHSGPYPADGEVPGAASAIGSSSDSPLHSQSKIPTMRTELISKVKVKNTPYLPKEVQRAPRSIDSSDNAPQSSFVGATYPDLPSARPRKVLFRDAPDEPGSFTSAGEVDERKPRTPVRSLKPAMHTSNGHDEVHNDTRALPGMENVMAASIMSNLTGEPEQAARSTTSDHELSSPRKRQRLEASASQDPQSNEPVSVYQQYDNQRMLERRKFYRSISTHWTNAGPENAEAFLRHNQRAYTKTSSRASSPRMSGRHSNASCSEAIGTSATNFSIHRSYIPKTPARILSSRRSSVSVNMESEQFASTFSKFKNAYPNYTGNQKSFRSALQLLLRLQSQPREPHPSLWDDFIFRMANDYKQYLAECIDNDESAVEYQDFYYSRVKRSRRTQEVITEDVLRNLDEDLKLDRVGARNSRPRQPRNLSSFLISNDIEMNDSPRPTAALTRETRGTYDQELPKVIDQPQPPAGAKRKRQKKDQYEILETQATPAERAALRPRQSLPSQPRRAQATPEMTMSAANKRKSLPWNATRSNNVATPSRIPLQRITNTSQTQSSTSLKVEKWLLTSRAAGAASPELEAMKLPTPEQAAHTSRPVCSSDVPPLRLSTSAVAAADEIFRSIESPANAPPRLKASIRPDTKFKSFASNYAKLQSERAFQSLSEEKRRMPINIYDW